MLKFEDLIDQLDSILKGKKSFWSLEAICHVDYEDVCQIIRIHVHNKFSQWDQSRPFSVWATEVVNHQILNLKEKYYGKFAPPCRKCKYDLGSNLCAKNVSGIKGSECPEFSKWEQKKEAAYRVILAESADKTYYEDEEAGQGGEGRIKIEAAPNPDYFQASSRLHELVMKDLNERMKKFYRLLYIENRSDEYVAKEMGLKTNEKGEKPGRRRLFSIKRILIDKAKKAMIEHDVFE